MKTNHNTEVLKLVARFLNNRPERRSVSAEYMLDFRRMRRKGRTAAILCALSLTVTLSIFSHRLATPTPFDGYGLLSDIVLTTLAIISAIAFLPTVWINLNLTELGYEHVWRVNRMFERTRQEFKKLFGWDILACKDANLLALEVRTLLYRRKQTAVTAQGEKRFDDEKTAREELKKLWNIGDEFVPVPSYPELFA